MQTSSVLCTPLLALILVLLQIQTCRCRTSNKHILLHIMKLIIRISHQPQVTSSSSCQIQWNPYFMFMLFAFHIILWIFVTYQPCQMSTSTMLYFNGFCISQLHIFPEFNTEFYSPECKCAVQWSALEVCGVHTIVGPKFTRPAKELAEQEDEFAESMTTCLDKLKGLEVARKCMHQFTFRTALL